MPETRAPTAPFVGMGLTYFFKEQVYGGTIVRVADDLQSISFVQDRPHSPTRGGLTAFIFTPGGGSAYDARYEARIETAGYAWNGRVVQLGVRRWVTAP